MRIHCDRCGIEIDEETAEILEADDGEVLYFCSAACREAFDSYEIIEDPDPEEDRAAPQA